MITDEVKSLLRDVKHVGGDQGACKMLRAWLGADALQHKHDLRMVGLGCADGDTVARLEDALATHPIQ